MIPAAVPAAAVGVAIGVALASGAGAWWAVSTADGRTEKVTAEREAARSELAAQNASLRVLTEAGMAARKEGARALEETRRTTTRDRSTIARLRAEIAAGGDLSCTDAVEQVRRELRP